MNSISNDVATHLAEVRRRLERACRDCEREAASVTLVCVSKTFAADHIIPALDSGERVFGENRVQEAQAKWPILRERYSNIDLHLIGPLQSNKTADAVMTFDTIETVDRPKIVRALADAVQAAGRCPRLYVQVNTGAEPQKAGVVPDEADAFIASCRGEHGLEIDGLMCIPPINDQASPHFALLNTIAARNGIASLSMGMSADYEMAIPLGATHVRVGSAIFGSRQTVQATTEKLKPAADYRSRMRG